VYTFSSTQNFIDGNYSFTSEDMFDGQDIQNCKNVNWFSVAWNDVT